MKKIIAVVLGILMAEGAVFAQMSKKEKMIASNKCADIIQKAISQKEKIDELMSDDDFVLVWGGSFFMGSMDGEEDEKPVHKVTLNPFFMGKYEVTQDIYLAITGENPSDCKSDRLPVEEVSWSDAIFFCNVLSIVQGKTPCYAVDGKTNPKEWNYIPNNLKHIFGNITCDFQASGWRLPTEAEWEYATAEGNENSAFKYSGSDDVNEVAWYLDNSFDRDECTEIPHQVGSKKANALGIYDLSGNVSEMCWDFYSFDNYYSSSPKSNPTGPEDGCFRILRGGDCCSKAIECRVTDREDFTPDTRHNTVGFRLVRSLGSE